MAQRALPIGRVDDVADPVPLGAPPEALAPIDGMDPGPPPGWYALSVDLMRARTQEYEFFLRDFEPIETAGYSIYIYYLTVGCANGGRNAAEEHISD